MNFKKALFCVSFGLIGSGVLSLALFNSRVSPANASSEKGVSISRDANFDENSFPGEKVITKELLSVSATASAKTTMGQSITFKFSTGGTGYQDTTKTFVSAPTDDKFEEYWAKFSSMTDEEKEELAERILKGEEQTTVFSGQIATLAYNASTTNIVIPRYLLRGLIETGVFFKIGSNEIMSNALLIDEVNKGIKSITIPKNVDTIYESSFPEELTSDFVFNVEYKEDEVPSSWDPNWAHGATVNYNYPYQEGRAEPSMAGATVEYGDKTLNYIVGYYPKEGDRYPLVMSYKLKGETETRYFEFKKSETSSKGSDFDSVGYKLSAFSNSFDADVLIPLGEDDEIDFDSVVIHNIFNAKEISEGGATKYVPDMDNRYYCHPSQGFLSTLAVDHLVSYEFDGISDFAGYTSVDLLVDRVGDETYAAAKSSFVSQYKSEIESGRMQIRYRFTSLKVCKFKVTYDKNGTDETVIVPIDTPIDQHILSKKTGNRVSFLFKNSSVGEGFNSKSIRELSFLSFYVTLDLFDRSNGVVARSALTSRFGYFMVMPYTAEASVFNINSMLIIMSVSYAVGFMALATVGFFYFKNKFKNDEFRRIKPKKYWVKAVMAMVGGLIVILFFTFIVIRATAFNNAVVVYNPVDAYIIITAVASVLIVGYFIKYLVVTTKANKARKRTIKLKLNEDVADDGTK